ncbi:DUF6059 family protein [Streptomyces hydrogenans]|uniref:DUF6059 family protein n=1 Tax=Streptomyces hydrogenans TaxID=1873719 RepID=UPI00332BF2E7
MATHVPRPLRRLAGSIWYALQCAGSAWVHIPGWVPEPPGDDRAPAGARAAAAGPVRALTGPGTGHPERLAVDVPMSAEERLLWQQLGAHW